MTRSHIMQFLHLKHLTVFFFMCAKIEHFHLWKQLKRWFSLIKPICNLQNIFDILLRCITAFGAFYAVIKYRDTRLVWTNWTCPSSNLYSSQIIHQRAHTIWAVGNRKRRCGKPWSRGLIKTYSEYFWGKRYTFKEWTLPRRKPNTNLHFCEVYNAMLILSEIQVYLTAYFWKVGKQQLS